MLLAHILLFFAQNSKKGGEIMSRQTKNVTDAMPENMTAQYKSAQKESAPASVKAKTQKKCAKK